MVVDRPIACVRIVAPAVARRGGTAPLTIRVEDDVGTPVPAVVPLRVEVRDSAGREAEWTGWHATRDGELNLMIEIAPNDESGFWEIRARELASNRSAAAWLQVEQEEADDAASAAAPDVPRSTAAP